jgi:hypothetical protein
MFRDLLNKIELIETAEVIPFPGVPRSHTQILDAAPEELKQVISIAKIYLKHKNLWFSNKKELDKAIALHAKESLERWATYFDYDDVDFMLSILQKEKLL